MATDYHHGVRVIEINEGSRPIRTVSAQKPPTTPRTNTETRRPAIF